MRHGQCQAPQPMVRQVPWILFELRSWAKWLPKNKISPTFHAKSSQARLHCQTNPSTNLHWMANLDVGVTPIQFARDWMVVPIPLLCGIWTRPAACSWFFGQAQQHVPCPSSSEYRIHSHYHLSSTIIYYQGSHRNCIARPQLWGCCNGTGASPARTETFLGGKIWIQAALSLMQSCTKNGLLINLVFDANN